jgi:hypothetical protein
MATARFARITRERPVLNRLVWYRDPIPIDIHLHPSRGHTVKRGSTVVVVAAARAFGIAQVRVDVVGVSRKLELDRKKASQKGKFAGHGPLPQNGVGGARQSVERTRRDSSYT